MHSSSPKPDLKSQLRELRAQLDEANETLRAIREGEVDGLVVWDGNDERVYTLQGAETPYRVLIEEMREGALTVADDGTIVFCNRRFAEMVGVGHSHVVGSSLYSYVLVTDQALLKRALAASAAQPEKLELQLVHHSGLVIPIYLSASLLPGDRPHPVFCVVATDLTQQKHHEKVAAAQEQLRDSESKLRLLNETLEQQVKDRSAVAEDRARQLQALAVQLTHAEQQERRRLAQVLHDHLQQILVAAQMRLGMFAQIHEISQATPIANDAAALIKQAIEASRELTVQLNPPVLNDRGLGPALEWLGRSMFNRHGLTVEVAVGPEPSGLSEDLRSLIFQAARELLFNVVKHSGVRQASLTMETFSPDAIRIVVTDGGKGFDVLTNVGPLASGKHFGLYSIRERLALLGGELVIDTSIAKGTRIAIVAPLTPLGVPLAPSLAPKVVHATGRKPPSQTRKIPQGVVSVLLADDHRMMREGLAKLLESTPGLQVIGQVSDGHEAVEAARELKPDVIVMDVGMPIMNGIEATRVITAEMSVRVIGLSMHERESMAAAMKAAGASAYLTKGGPAEDLIAAIFDCSTPTPLPR